MAFQETRIHLSFWLLNHNYGPAFFCGASPLQNSGVYSSRIPRFSLYKGLEFYYAIMYVIYMNRIFKYLIITCFTILLLGFLLVACVNPAGGIVNMNDCHHATRGQYNYRILFADRIVLENYTYWELEKRPLRSNFFVWVELNSEDGEYTHIFEFYDKKDKNRDPEICRAKPCYETLRMP